MRVSDLGQLRVAGRIANEYSNVSRRPYPFKSEDQLIEEGIETDLIPPWGEIPAGDGKPMVPAYSWPDYVPPPPVPSLEEEVYAIRRSDTSTIYPWAGTWNDNRISTKELEKTTYPKSPAMADLGVVPGPGGDAGALAGMAALGLIMTPIWGTLAYASFRAIGKEEKTLLKIALGTGGVIFGLSAVGAALTFLGGTAGAVVAANR